MNHGCLTRLWLQPSATNTKNEVKTVSFPGMNQAHTGTSLVTLLQEWQIKQSEFHHTQFFYFKWIKLSYQSILSINCKYRGKSASGLSTVLSSLNWKTPSAMTTRHALRLYVAELTDTGFAPATSRARYWYGWMRNTQQWPGSDCCPVLPAQQQRILLLVGRSVALCDPSSATVRPAWATVRYEQSAIASKYEDHPMVKLQKDWIKVTPVLQ